MDSMDSIPYSMASMASMNSMDSMDSRWNGGASSPSGHWASLSSQGVCADGGGCGGRVVEC